MSLTDVTNFIQFDHSKAKTYKPVPRLKFAEIIEKPDDEVTQVDGPKGLVEFRGDYVQVYDLGGDPVYGCAVTEWLAAHEADPEIANAWVETASVEAYQADSAGILITRVDGNVETVATVEHGDWIVRQIGGKIQHIKQDKFPQLYQVNG